MKKSILNLKEYGVVELNCLESQSTNGGWVVERFGQLVGHLHNALDWVLDTMCTGGTFVQSNVRSR